MSMRMKLKTIHFIRQVEQHDEWDEVEEGDIVHAQESAAEVVDAAIIADRKTIYATQVSKEALKQHLKLVKNRATVLAVRAKSAPRTPMPATLHGKVLTAYLKNGRGLCAAYNVMDSCSAVSEEACGRVHLCSGSVLHRRGRACGGRHPAHPRISLSPSLQLHHRRGLLRHSRVRAASADLVPLRAILRFVGQLSPRCHQCHIAYFFQIYEEPAFA